MSTRKMLVIDTSVLLYDMRSIHSFPGNDVVIPLIVLDELDRFKEKPGLLGESARYVNRFLDNLREHGKLDQGITIPESDQTIRVALKTPRYDMLNDWDQDKGDNRIISIALGLKDENNDEDVIVKVITKDINLRVKCDALGIHAEDYFADHIDIEAEGEYKGWREIALMPEQIDDFYSSSFDVPKDLSLIENEFVVAKAGSSSFIALHKNGKFNKLNSKIESISKIEPKNKEQKFAIESLLREDIPLVTLTGLAGSGKTFLTLMAALEARNRGDYSRIVFTRSLQSVGKDMGYLPGDLKEKMAPWLAPIVDNFRHVFKDVTYFDMMIERGEIEIAPLSYIRGRTFNDSFVIVDEAQNATIHELKTIITRIGTNSKVVLLGDTDQIDTPYIGKNSNGLSIVINKFKKSPLHAHVHLARGQRSELASAASKIL